MDREWAYLIVQIMSIIVMLATYVVPMILSIAVIVFTYVCYWKIYKKAGYEGWEALIPYYCNYIQSEITLGKGIWFLFLLIPCVGMVFAYIMLYRLGMAFQKDTGFCIGLVLVPAVFLAILAFSKENNYRKLEPMF